MLRRRELGEADLLLTLFSPTHGRIQASARSARKPTAKLMGKLEPCMELELMLARGKTLDVVTEATLVAARSALRDDLLRVAYASYLLELFDSNAEAVDDAAPLYVILSHALSLLEADATPEMTLRWCEIRLVGELGWEPQMDGCVGCEGGSGGGP
ncbi:MAG: DNA repair protein RecO, partial [Candidatus Xenobia bacterium]